MALIISQGKMKLLMIDHVHNMTAESKGGQLSKLSGFTLSF